MTSNEWYGKKIQEIIDKGNLCMKKARLLAKQIPELQKEVYNKLTEYGKEYEELREFMQIGVYSSIYRQYEFWCRIEKEY